MNDQEPTRLRKALEREVSEIEWTAKGEGHKSSEGDGRTAADIEREEAAKAAQEDE